MTTGGELKGRRVYLVYEVVRSVATPIGSGSMGLCPPIFVLQLPCQDEHGVKRCVLVLTEGCVGRPRWYGAS